jgi:hypothetical protein
MFDGFFARMRLRSAARDYAARLGPQLLAGYGPGPTYNFAQIQRAVLKAGLPAEHIRLGCAMFMTEEAFAALDLSEATGGYVELLAMMQRYVPRRTVSGSFEPAPENFYAAGGYASGGSHHPGSVE